MRIERTISIPEDASFHELYQVTGREWWEMPTISSGQDADLKYESERYRVWYSRMHPSDYFPEQVADGTYSNERVQIEELVNGRWVLLDRYGKRV